MSSNSQLPSQQLTNSQPSNIAKGISSGQGVTNVTSAKGVNIGLGGHMPNMPDQQFLKYVLHSVPSLKQDVVKILQRKDLTEQQRIDRIATLFRNSAKQNQGSSKKDPS